MSVDFKNKAFFKLKRSDDYADKVQDLLLPGEEVIAGFKSMRDGVVFTSHRLISVNVQGMTGSKKDFTSLPYSKATGFSVETAGTFDLDAEVTLYYSEIGTVKFEFKGDTPVAELAKVIGAKCMGL